MSKIFSITGLETNTRIQDAEIPSGIPECMAVAVQSFRYGHGPPEPVGTEEQSWIGLRGRRY